MQGKILNHINELFVCNYIKIHWSSCTFNGSFRQEWVYNIVHLLLGKYLLTDTLNVDTLHVQYRHTFCSLWKTPLNESDKFKSCLSIIMKKALWTLWWRKMSPFQKICLSGFLPQALLLTGFPRWLHVKNPPVNARYMGLIPELGKPPGEGNGNPLQHCLGILAWEIPWTEDPGGPQFTGSQRVEHDLANINNILRFSFSIVKWKFGTQSVFINGTSLAFKAEKSDIVKDSPLCYRAFNIPGSLTKHK